MMQSRRKSMGPAVVTFLAYAALFAGAAALAGCPAAPQDAPASTPALSGTITRIESQGRNSAQIVVDDRPDDAVDGMRVRVLPATRIVRRSGHVQLAAADLKTGEHVDVWYAGAAKGGSGDGGSGDAPATPASASIVMLEDVPGRSPAAAAKPPVTPPVSAVKSEPAETPPPMPPASPEPEPARSNLITLRGVRQANHHDFDRVVFEFEGDALPAYSLGYLDGAARQCGSGQAVKIGGKARLEVRLEGCRAHDEAGRLTIDSRDYRPKFPVVEEIVLTCDFEGHVTWVAGLSARKKYEVHELHAPARLVIDVSH